MATVSDASIVRNPWRAEAKALVLLGIPMALTQMVQFSINTIDVLMIGQLGPEALAASSLGLVIYFAVYMLGMGPAIAVSPMVSHVLGAKSDNYTDARRSVRMGLWSIVIAYPLALLIFIFAGDITTLFGQPAGPTRLAGPYVLALAPGLPFALGVMVLRNFLAAIDRTRVPLILIVLTTFINAGLNWLLIYGNWGFPRLELIGAGIGSSLSHLLGFAMLIGYIYFDKHARKFHLLGGLLNPDWPRLREIIVLGWPISITTFFEGMLFNACVFVAGRIGVNALAAFHMVLNLSALVFMMALGLSMAGGVRVGLAVGAGQRAGAYRASVVTIAMSAFIMFISAVCVLSFPTAISGFYLDLSDPETAPVLALVILFLPIAAAFMVFDGVQVAANQCLRGLKDVRAPMIITGVSYWVIGFPVAVWLGLGTPMGATGIWWGLLAGLLAASLLLGGRLFYLLRHPECPAFKANSVPQ